MKVRSLGYRTDLIFHRFSGEVTDRGPYLVIRTPENPTYRWGNFLLFENPPVQGDFERWNALFEREIGTLPDVSHKVFGWDAVDGEKGEVTPFLDAGYKLEQSVVMAADTLTEPPRYNCEVEVRVLESEADYAQVVNLHVLSRPQWESEAGYRRFWEGNIRGFKKMIAAGRGRWFGAFLDGQLIADMGLFSEVDLARYQAVVTHPNYRRRGVCGTLLYEVGRYGLERMGAKTLVIVADEHYFAKGIYASVGFEAKERQVGIDWHLPDV